MIDKDWDDTPYVDGDCIRDEDEWNDMVTYIKHSASIDFTIYDDEDSSNQAFRFTISGDFSMIYGHADSGKDMLISANDSNTYPRIALFGDSDIWLASADDIYFKQNATQMAKMEYAANVTTFNGGALGGDDLLIKGSDANDYSSILIQGAGSIYYYCTSTFAHNFNEATNTFLSLYENGTDDVIEGKTAGNDLYLKPVGLLKWGTEQTNAGSDRGELIPMKTAAGTTVYLKTYDLV